MTGLPIDPVLDRIARLIARRIGVVTTRTQADLERAVHEVVAHLGLRSLDDLANRLAAGALWNELIDRVTVRETYFFRSPEHFELLRGTILPAIERDRPERHHLRVWSAGCASGEEAYSLAIELHRAGLLDDASILGTDVSHDALAKARAGRYREWSFRATDPAALQQYLRRDRNERVVAEFIREHVRFDELNLVEGDLEGTWSALGQFDVIFCRNVLIYFDAPTSVQVERRLFEALAPGGWLVPGPSDPPLGAATGLEVVLFEQGVCYRRPALHEQAPVPRARPSPSPLPAPEGPSVTAPPRRSADEPAEPEALYTRAAAAFERAAYAEVIELARRSERDARVAAIAVRAIWNQSGATPAERACAQALKAHPLSSELHYLHAILLMDGRRLAEALRAVRHALYLDRTLTVAHFAHGTILERLHDLDGARRAYRNTYDACTKQLPDEALPLGDGIVAQGLANAAAHALQELSKRCPA